MKKQKMYWFDMRDDVSRKEAKAILNCMRLIIAKHGFVSLADFHDLEGSRTVCKADAQMVCESLDGSKVSLFKRGGRYYIKLPEFHIREDQKEKEVPKPDPVYESRRIDFVQSAMAIPKTLTVAMRVPRRDLRDGIDANADRIKRVLAEKLANQILDSDVVEVNIDQRMNFDDVVFEAKVRLLSAPKTSRQPILGD